jgi:hypothetical protein
MRLRRPFVPLALAVPLILAVSTTGCLGCSGSGDGEDEASIDERLDETGSLDVVEWAAQAEYEAPEDGKLSEAQMEMYVAVQQRAVKIRQVARQRMGERTGEDGEGERRVGLNEAVKALSDLGDMVTAELRAARELGENPAEYQWVVGKVAEARIADAGNKMRVSMAQAGGSALQSLEERLAESDDEGEKEALRQQVEKIRQSLAEQENATPSEAAQHNLALYETYRTRIEAVERDGQHSMDG